MWLDGRAVGFLVGAKAESDIREERVHDKSAFPCHLLGWSPPGPLACRLMFPSCMEQAHLCFH